MNGVESVMKERTTTEEGSVEKVYLDYREMAYKLRSDIVFLDENEGFTLSGDNLLSASAILIAMSDAVDNIQEFENSLAPLYRKGSVPVWGKLGELYKSYVENLYTAVSKVSVPSDIENQLHNSLSRFKIAGEEVLKMSRIYTTANSANQLYLSDKGDDVLLPFVYRYTDTDSAGAYASPTTPMLEWIDTTDDFISTGASKLKISNKELDVYELLIGDIALLGRSLDSGVGLYSTLPKTKSELEVFLDLSDKHMSLLVDILSYFLHPLFKNKKFTLAKSRLLSLFIERLRGYCGVVDSYYDAIIELDFSVACEEQIKINLKNFIDFVGKIEDFRRYYGGKASLDTKIMDKVNVDLMEKIELLTTYNGSHWHHTHQSMEHVKESWTLLGRYRRLLYQRGSTILMLNNLLAAKYSYYLSGYVIYTVLMYSDVALGKSSWETNLSYHTSRSTLHFVPEYNQNASRLVSIGKGSINLTPVADYIEEDNVTKDGIGFWSSKLEYDYVLFVEELLKAGLYECPSKGV